MFRLKCSRAHVGVIEATYARSSVTSVMYTTHELPGSVKKTCMLACLCLTSIIFTLLLLTLRLICCQAPPLWSGTVLLLLLLLHSLDGLAVVWDSTSCPVHLLLSFLSFPLSPSRMSAAPVHEVRSSPLCRLKVNMYEVILQLIQWFCSC